MWKSTLMILQSCYKRTFTTFCTHERRRQKPFFNNHLTSFTVLDVPTGPTLRAGYSRGENLFVEHLPIAASGSTLLIVGPRKINSNVLRQTDGERFFE